MKKEKGTCIEKLKCRKLTFLRIYFRNEFYNFYIYAYLISRKGYIIEVSKYKHRIF